MYRCPRQSHGGYRATSVVRSSPTTRIVVSDAEYRFSAPLTKMLCCVANINPKETLKRRFMPFRVYPRAPGEQPLGSPSRDWSLE
jgi:hypothetical protein